MRAHLERAFTGKFRVIRELTGGGMSRVFLAEDLALEREIVIKVVSPHLADAALLQRFREEVLHTARLQHPTIVSVYDVGTLSVADGQVLPYYIMPYVRGESLRARLQHDGSLSINVALRVLRSVLDALAYAHAHGVVHRDIKPENVFLSGGNAVLADFGVAKAVAGSRATSSVTRPGTAVGTPAYMAPEQLAGEVSVEPRADLYAVGVVAYEMLAGRLPWVGGTPSEVLAAQARTAPMSLRAVRGDVPAALDDVILRCLAWESSKRPASALDVLHVLESVAATPHTPTAVTTGAFATVRRLSRWRTYAAAGVVVAVLAVVVVFAPWGGRESATRGGAAPDRNLAVLYPEFRGTSLPNARLGAQIFHGVAAMLRGIAGLKVAGEVTVDRLTRAGVSARAIADSLRAHGFDSAVVVVVGLTTSGAYELTPSLRDLANGRDRALGAPTVLHSLDEMRPDSAERLARALANGVARALALDATTRDIAETENAAAAAARREAREALAARTPAGIRAAVAALERAIALDPNYAQAHADLAQTLAIALFYHYRLADRPPDVATRAFALASRAAQLQPKLAEAHIALGYLGGIAGAPATYVRDRYRDASRLAPEHPSYGVWSVIVAFNEGRQDEALARLRAQVSLEPRAPSPRISLALYSLAARRYGDAVEHAEAARRIEPGVPYPASLEIWARVLEGADAVSGCASVAAGPHLGARATCLVRLQRADAARAVRDSLQQLAAANAGGDSSFDASIYVAELATHLAVQHDTANARNWLRNAYYDSPVGVDQRVLVSGLFPPSLVAYADTLRADAWKRIARKS